MSRTSVLALIVGMTVGTAVAVPVLRSTEPPAVETRHGLGPDRVRDLDIEFYRRRVERDPRSAADFARLTGYLQRARETGDNTDLERAETEARRSLALRAGRNAPAFGVLASSLMSQHRFADALATAERLVSFDSTALAPRAMLGEVQFELGHYDDARHTFGMLATHQRHPSVAPRLARWEELNGRPELARRLLRLSLAEVQRQPGIPAEQLAWFHLRLGDLALRYGHPREADNEFRAGLAIAPDDSRLLGAVARLESARHRWARAIAAGERAITVSLDPGTLGVLSDAYAALGDSARATEYARVMGVAVLRQPGPFHRAWSLFLLDHGREVPTVLAKARAELRTRHDIYGEDLLAWALHKAGRDDEARAPMTRALALGSRDPMLRFHAGMIARATGDTAGARVQLTTALEINRAWHPSQPAEAGAVLDSLAKGR